MKKSKNKDKIKSMKLSPHLYLSPACGELRYMIILAIETSCDDTCCSFLEIKNKQINLLSNIVSSQNEIHKKWGGICPTLAKREHQKSLPIVLKKAQKKAKNPKIDLIAVTVGPGLEPCLWTGVNFAKKLAQNWNLPIIPINHIEAHIVANFIHPNYQSPTANCRMKQDRAKNNMRRNINKFQNIFPSVCLVVSGGHTQLILMRDIGKYKILGETRDDAAGECFDKTARILGLSYPGGPAIAAKAAKYKIQDTKHKIQLPRPMIHQKNYDFSFSGLKTAVLYNYQKHSTKIRRSEKYIQAMAIEIQQAIIDVLLFKTLKAAKDYKTKTIILCGGVAANNELRKQFKFKIQSHSFTSGQNKIQFLVPSKNLCADNAAMIGITAYYHWLSGKIKFGEMIKVDANLRIS